MPIAGTTQRPVNFSPRMSCLTLPDGRFVGTPAEGRILCNVGLSYRANRKRAMPAPTGNIDVQNADATATRDRGCRCPRLQRVRPAVDQGAFGVLSGRYMRPAMAPPLTESTSPVT